MEDCKPRSMAIAYSMKKKAKSKMAEGGSVGEDKSMDHSEDIKEMEHQNDDLVGRILSKRQPASVSDDDLESLHRYSHGGRVANGGDDALDQMADGDPNNFDDLALRDDLEFHYSGKNSGDEIGDHQESEDRKDMVERILRAKSMKRNHNPRPA